HRGSTLASRPGRQRPAIDRLAAPGATHDLERAHQGAEALVVIGTQEIEIGPRRAAADAEAQPPPGQRLNRLHAMGELDRITQRHLQHSGAELDPRGRDAERSKRHERIQSGPAAPERVGHPDPREATSFDLSGVVGDATERPAAGLAAGAHKGHYTQSHDRLPTGTVAVTSGSPLFAGRQCNTSTARANSRLIRPLL